LTLTGASLAGALLGLGGSTAQQPRRLA
jgi:hypothetical protein